MANDLFLKTANSVHRTLVKVTGGRLGWEAGKMPVLQLTTIGRKSGEPRTVMLTTPHRQGDTIVIVASKGGDDRHPGGAVAGDHREARDTDCPGTPGGAQRGSRRVAALRRRSAPCSAVVRWCEAPAAVVEARLVTYQS